MSLPGSRGAILGNKKPAPIGALHQAGYGVVAVGLDRNRVKAFRRSFISVMVYNGVHHHVIFEEDRVAIVIPAGNWRLQGAAGGRYGRVFLNRIAVLCTDTIHVHAGPRDINSR